MIPILRPFAPFAFLLLGSILAGQTKEPAQEHTGPPVLSLSEIVLDQYSVQNVDPDELFELAKQMVGRSYYVRERGGLALNSLRLLGTKIVLYDTLEQVKRAQELLARLDVPRETTRTSWKSVEYRPRFVSLKAAEKAIEDRLSVNRVAERGLLVLSADAETLESALALLKRLDVPEKQVLLTCQLIEVGGTPQGPPLPRELLENLQKLLPQSQFTQTGMAMLKTSVGGEDSISIRLESPDYDYRLAFTPVAFDESSGSLTVIDCKLMQDWSDGERELFHTNTVLHGGEYTVLAATGATPKLLVLRVTPQG